MAGETSTQAAPSEVEVHLPPSQQACPGPVPKGGEPVVPTKGHLAEPQTLREAIKETIEDYQEDRPAADQPAPG